MVLTPKTFFTLFESGRKQKKKGTWKPNYLPIRWLSVSCWKDENGELARRTKWADIYACAHHTNTHVFAHTPPPAACVVEPYFYELYLHISQFTHRTSNRIESKRERKTEDFLFKESIHKIWSTQRRISLQKWHPEYIGQAGGCIEKNGP